MIAWTIIAARPVLTGMPGLTGTTGATGATGSIVPPVVSRLGRTLVIAGLVSGPVILSSSGTPMPIVPGSIVPLIVAAGPLLPVIARAMVVPLVVSSVIRARGGSLVRCCSSITLGITCTSARLRLGHRCRYHSECYQKSCHAL